MSDPVILYVEDDPLSRVVMEVLLTRVMGYRHITIFEDGTDFMNRLKALPSRPDVIFLDIHMEPVDGFAVLHLIRQDEAFRSTRVVALTASVMNEEVKRLKDAGFNGVIAKPLDADAFPRTLHRILSGEQVWNVK
jgi:two-component system sensor histidine kinase EvgS